MSDIDAIPHGTAVLRSLHARLSAARQPAALNAAVAHFEGVLLGLQLAQAITAEQNDALRRAAQCEFARTEERIGSAAPAEPVTPLLPGLQCALNALHHGMTGTQARAVIAELIADQHSPALVRAAAKAA